MGFSKMMEILQEKNRGKIVLCNMGNFYVAIGKDAVTLSKILNFKVSCFKPEVCKVGFPIGSLEKYTDLLQEKGYGYIVYYFDQQKEELEVLKQYIGKKLSESKVENINCYICSKGITKYKKTDNYILALARLYEREIKQQENLYKEEMNKRKRKIWFQKKNKKID